MRAGLDTVESLLFLVSLAEEVSGGDFRVTIVGDTVADDEMGANAGGSSLKATD